MTNVVYKRCSITLDLGTIRKCKELASEKGQSVSSLIRYLVFGAYAEARAAKGEEQAKGIVRASGGPFKTIVGRARAFNSMICYIEPMPEQTVIAWDVETIPDLSAAARMLDLGGATETEVRDALGSGFLKPSTP
jgi:hypothetical protein